MWFCVLHLCNAEVLICVSGTSLAAVNVSQPGGLHRASGDGTVTWDGCGDGMGQHQHATSHSKSVLSGHKSRLSTQRQRLGAGCSTPARPACCGARRVTSPHHQLSRGSQNCHIILLCAPFCIGICQMALALQGDHLTAGQCAGGSFASSDILLGTTLPKSKKPHCDLPHFKVEERKGCTNQQLGY